MKSEKYGIHGILYSFVTIAIVLFTLRMETTFFKFASNKNLNSSEVYNTAMSIVIVSSTVLFTFILFFQNQIAAILTRPEDFRFVVYFAFILFLDAIVSVPFAKLRQENRPIKFSSIKIANSVLTVILTIFCFNILPHIPSLNFLYAEAYFLDYVFLANLVASFILLLMLYKEVFIFRWSWNKTLVRQMLKFAWPLIIVGVAGAINQFSDRIFVSYLTESDGQEKSLVNAGLFTAAIKIAVIMNLFVTAFNYAAEPFFFKNSSEQAREKIYGNIALAFTICGSVIFMGVMFYLDILKYMISSEYRILLPIIVPVALLANLFLGLYYNFSIWYKLSGKTIYGAIIAVCGSILFISLNFLLIPSFGFMGANFASLACFILMCVLALWLGHKYYPIYYPLVRMSLYITCSILLWLGLGYFDLKGINQIISGTILILVYISIAYHLDIKRIIKKGI